jgi:radical SAM superfamily enzyme YgiQ (UPF0313 family)
MEKYNSYINVPGKGKKKFLNIIGSRGCPSGCYFCAATLLSGRRWRARSPGSIVSEIEHLIDEYGTEGIWFWDDTFNLNKERAKRVCDLIIEKGLNISWFCDIRVDTTDKELLTKMKRSGCFYTAFGVESGSQHVIDKYVKKNITLEKVKKVKEWCSELGIVGKGMFIISHPDETFEDARNTIKVMKELGGKNTINVLKIYPGTEVEKIARKKGILPKSFTWTRPFNQNTEILRPFVGDAPLFLDKMSVQEIMELLFMWAKLHKDRIHRRAITSIKNLKSFNDLKMLTKVGCIYIRKRAGL